MNFPHHEKLIPFLEHLETCSREDFDVVALDYATQSVKGHVDYTDIIERATESLLNMSPREKILIQNAATYAQIVGIFAAKEVGLENPNALNAIASEILAEARRVLCRDSMGEELFSTIPKWPVASYQTPRNGLATQEFIPSSSVPLGILDSWKDGSS